MLESCKACPERLKKGKMMLAIMLVVAMGLTSCVFTHTPSTPNPPSVTYKNVVAAEAQQLIQEKGNLIILDVRTQSEYDSGHILNAVLIPVDELADRLGELDKTKAVLVYSQDGDHIAQVRQILIDSKFPKVYNLEGGIIAWQEAGAAVNHPPIVENLTASEGHVIPASSCWVECICSDPDGDELNYEWASDGDSISGDGSNITWIAPDEVGTYNITVIVTDGHGGEGKGLLTINVAVNHRPVIEDLIVMPEQDGDVRECSEEPGKYKILKGKSCDIKCDASDPDKDKLSYKWLVTGNWTDGGEIFGRRFAVVTWTAPKEKDRGITITVKVSDGKGGTDTESIVFEVATCRCGLY